MTTPVDDVLGSGRLTPRKVRLGKGVVPAGSSFWYRPASVSLPTARAPPLAMVRADREGSGPAHRRGPTERIPLGVPVPRSK